MIDIHCHILPGIDDGAQNIKESLRMAKIAAADGITKIVATPHVKETCHSPDFLKKCVAKLNEILKERHVPVEILYGADVYAMVSPQDMPNYTINNSRYMLVEFPYDYLPGNATDILFNIALCDVTPIITHPERIPTVIRNPKTLITLLRGDIYVQITADSLVGNFGKEIQECACFLLKKEAVHFIASDAHSASVRRPVLSKAVKVAEKIVGKEKARALVEGNPSAVITGKHIPL